MKLRFSDRIEIITDQVAEVFDGVCGQLGDVSVSQTFGQYGLKVVLTAGETGVKFIRLRWNFTAKEKRTEPVRILGDEWERGYGVT